MQSRLIGKVVRVAVVLGAVASLGACASISERAWANGQAMSSSRAYRAAASGDMSVRTARELKSAASPLRLRFQEKPYSPFSDWWY
jgi:hypothetical protein